MLTESHYAARKFIRCRDKQIYRKHMCGLCHALGDRFGLLYRLFTNHETILLNLLTSAQQDLPSETILRRCPVNPMLTVRTNQNDSSDFAAAASVALASINIEDDIADSNGWNPLARLGRTLLQQPVKQAEQLLQAMQFNPAILQDLTSNQLQAEAAPGSDPTAPSAAVGAALFRMTAQLAQKPDNAPALAVIGEHYGAYIYLADAYRDFEKDIQRGEFNPLRDFVEEINGALRLSAEGTLWLSDQLKEILHQIQSNMEKIQFQHYQDTLTWLVTRPIQGLLQQVSGSDDSGLLCRVCNPVSLMSSQQEDGIALDELDEEAENSQKKGKKNRHKSTDQMCCWDCCYYVSSDDLECCCKLDCCPCDGDGCDCCCGDGCDCGDCDCN